MAHSRGESFTLRRKGCSLPGAQTLLLGECSQHCDIVPRLDSHDEH